MIRRRTWRGGTPFPIRVDGDRSDIIAAGTLVSLSLKGKVRWWATLPGPVYATPAVIPERDLLVAACFGGICSGVDLGTGQIVFRTELPRPWFAEVAVDASFPQSLR